VANSNRYYLTVAVAIALLIVALLVNISIGSVPIPLSGIADILMGGKENDQVFANIIWQIRLPKALTAILAGAGLSLGGLLTQTLFRNPLAGPDVLGLSAGSSLAVALVLLASFGLGTWTIAGASTIGAAGVFLIVMMVSKKISSNSSLLIIGLMIGALASSVVGILQFMSQADDLQIFTVWTMGNVSSANANELWIMFAFILTGVIVSVISLKSLNAWVMGEDYNQTMGLNISSFRWKILLATCLITGSITAFCGPISFVGIAVPHFMKIVFPSNNHGRLIPLTVIGGAILLLFCDILTMLPGNGTMLPINAATALFGAPVVIWIVIRSKKDFY